MEHISHLQKHKGIDVGIGNEIHPENGEGRVGKSGINKDFTLNQMIELAYKMEQKPNILIKAGRNAKWYIKKIDRSVLKNEIEKTRNWRNVTRCTMWIIEWD